jgi:hypothetical protein
MDLAFAYEFDSGEAYIYKGPSEPVPEPDKVPELPPEVWNTRPIDPDVCHDATMAMCR